MVVKEKVIFQEQKNFEFGKGSDSSAIIIYKSEGITRCVLTSCKRGDADIFLDLKETERLRMILERAVSSSSISQKGGRGFCGPLVSPQAGDVPDSIVNAIVEVVFLEKVIGIAIDVIDVGGVEVWLSVSETKQIINAL